MERLASLFVTKDGKVLTVTSLPEDTEFNNTGHHRLNTTDSTQLHQLHPQLSTCLTLQLQWFH